MPIDESDVRFRRDVKKEEILKTVNDFNPHLFYCDDLGFLYICKTENNIFFSWFDQPDMEQSDGTDYIMLQKNAGAIICSETSCEASLPKLNDDDIVPDYVIFLSMCMIASHEQELYNLMYDWFEKEKENRKKAKDESDVGNS